MKSLCLGLPRRSFSCFSYVFSHRTLLGLIWGVSPYDQFSPPAGGPTIQFGPDTIYPEPAHPQSYHTESQRLPLPFQMPGHTSHTCTFPPSSYIAGLPQPPSLGSKFARELTELRETCLLAYYITKLTRKDTDEQPGEEVHKARSEEGTWGLRALLGYHTCPSTSACSAAQLSEHCG